MKSTLYTTKGDTAGEIEIPESVFGLNWNSDLVHQVVTVQRANRRTPVAHAKDRSGRSGGGAKPWRQKGTGRARHGSRRSPIWRKGGVTHGPRNEKVLGRDLPAKMRRKALYTILSRKFRDGEVLFVDDLQMQEPKTAAAKQAIEGVSSASGTDELANRRSNAAFIAVPEASQAAKKSFRNFSNMRFDEVRNMNALDVASYKYIIIADPKNAFGQFDSKSSDA